MAASWHGKRSEDEKAGQAGAGHCHTSSAFGGHADKLGDRQTGSLTGRDADWPTGSLAMVICSGTARFLRLSVPRS